MSIEDNWMRGCEFFIKIPYQITRGGGKSKLSTGTINLMHKWKP
jgi:hypothetical protein